MILESKLNYLQNRRERINQFLIKTLEFCSEAPERLYQAMHYAIAEGGKRIRPLLVYATGETLGADLKVLDVAASTIEIIHTYSLVHDDLPAMDNADLRRGKPSCHRAFDEATAILVGDALFPLALQILVSTSENILSLNQKARMMEKLVRAAGANGMAGGQQLDLNLNHTIPNVGDLERLYQMKTGALLSACIELGIIAAQCENTQQIEALDEYGKHIGLAFQIQDDILDIEIPTNLLGKTQGKDKILHKSTLPMLIGIEAAKARVKVLYEQSLSCIDRLSAPSSPLHQLTESLYTRDS